jgi:phage terminase large subunit-like protein
MVLAVAPTLQQPPRAPRTPRGGRARTKTPAQPFTLAHFRAWASDLILDTGENWRLEGFQEAFVEDLFVGFPEAWLIVPEGNTKTTTLAGVALYHAEHRPFAAVPVAAASREQAEILYRQAEGFVLRSERLHRPVHSAIQAAKGKRKLDVPRFTCLEGYRRINHHGGGRIQIFAADDRTGDGIIPTFGIIDEPHRLRDLSLYRTWAGKIAKRGGQLATISTSGEPGSDFEETRGRIRDGATDVQHAGSFSRYATPRVVLHEWAVPESGDVEDMAAVKAANPFSGITVDMLAEKFASPTMTRHHWLRFVCNRPTRDSDVWLGEDGETLWRDTEDPYELVAGARTWLGVDIALRRDTSAVVTMQQRPDGRYHAVLRVWVPTEDRPIDVTDVMHHIRQAAGTYDVEAVSFDPRFFDVPAKMLADEGLPMTEVPQSVERMTAAYGSLYEGIQRGQITHEADEVFASHVLNAVPRYSERGFMLEKSKSRAKIDGGVALALAYDQALRHEAPEPSVYEARGALVLG